MGLSRDQILTAEDGKVVTVPVPEWGGEVCVRMLPAAERSRFEAGCIKTRKGETVPDLADVDARFAALVICDESGRRLFSDDDGRALGRTSAKAIARVVEAGKALNGMTAESLKEAEGN